MYGDCEDREPTRPELTAIEAELELLDAEIVALVTRDETSERAWRRLRRAQRRVLAARGAGAQMRGVSGEEVA